MSTTAFLSDAQLRPVALKDSPFPEAKLALGPGASGLEVVIVDATARPKAPQVRNVWRTRHGGRAAPVLLVVLHGDKAALCGPSGDEPPLYENVGTGQAERICKQALSQVDRHAAIRYLRDALPSVHARLPGVRNEGFLATHELAVGARKLAAWPAAEKMSKPLLAKRSEDLLKSLGFHIEKCDQVTSILRTAEHGQRVAVAVLLKQSESPELQAERFGGLSPVTYALAVANRENLPYMLLQQGARLRLYPVKLGVGVGRRGPSDTYIELHTDLLQDQDSAYLWLLFSAAALADEGSLDQLLAESKRFAGELAEKLRNRIYDEVIPRLAQGLAVARGIKKPKVKDLRETYEMAMITLFRLLFIAYAEDKNLLPYEWNGLYRNRSLKQKATDLLDLYHQGVQFDDGHSLWDEVLALFHAVRDGHREWGIPKYNGGLFSDDPKISKAGELLEKVALPNTVMGHALHHLLLVGTPEGLGPVDFRSLGVREFGTVYEGLLESELAVAETDLTTDTNGFYRPAREGEEVQVTRSHVYLHNRSGARKASGTYFTKPFAVDHLLDNALEPALEDHCRRLDVMDEDAAATALFDFRIADIAMGSGHFLVAAVDRIERKLSTYLSRRNLPGVYRELHALRISAEKVLEGLKLEDQIEIEDAQLLRRLIARRCIYGVDINEIAVQLSRLSIWIHTFVPGLPLSVLDHNLVPGNALVGIGTIQEIIDKAKEEDFPLLRLDAKNLVGEAVEPLNRLARIADTTLEDIERARKAIAEAKERIRPAEALFDIVTACRLRQERLPVDLSEWDQRKRKIVGSPEHKQAEKELEDLEPFHFPIAFPEVFLRKRSGFDVILGNPPWEEVTVEEHAFWARHEPGLRGLNQRQQERLKESLREARSDLVSLYEEEAEWANEMRNALVTGPYPGMGTGDPDLYKAFCWRFWQLAAADGGRIGVVLPRSAWNAKGTSEFRQHIFKTARTTDIAVLVNNRQWVFHEVHPQYSIGLVAIDRTRADVPVVRLRGPFASLVRFEADIARPPAVFPASEVMNWTDTASLPLLPSEESLEVFGRLRSAPRLDKDDPQSWRTRPHRELDATNDKHFMDVKSESKPRGFWPVFKGESFDLWDPDTGRYYAWADPKDVVEELQRKRLSGRTKSNSVYFEFQHDRLESWWRDTKTLPCYRARIAFRDITRATDSRTMRAALLPPRTFITNKGPYFLWVRGDECSEAYLLGVLSSLSLDWYARRFVETGMNFFVLNPFPIPRPAPDDPLAKRTIQIAGRLAAIDDRFAEWAEAVAVECGPLESTKKFDLICELDAVVALLYGLEEQHLKHIFETFHEPWKSGATADHPTLGNYDDRLKQTLKHYKNWEKKARPTMYERLEGVVGKLDTKARNSS